jgi:2-dehydro-3-deoxygluconokinase
VPEARPAVDVATLGEAMIRFSVRPGARIEDAPAYDVHVAGAEANVAFALARMGVSAAWASVLPRNPLGQRIATALRSGGVDLTPLAWVDQGRVGTYFVELATPPRPTTVTYDRAGSAMALAGPDALDWEAVCDARLVHVTGITFGLSASARAMAERAVAEARARGRLVSLDVNYRARLWGPDQAGAALRGMAGRVDLLLCKREDAGDLFGCRGSAREVARRLQDEFRVARVAVTCGAEPAVALDGDQLVECPSYAVQIVDRIGAGDAFAAGVLWGFLEGSLASGLERGVAMAALKMTVAGDLFTLDRTAVETLLSREGRDVSR